MSRISLNPNLEDSQTIIISINCATFSTDAVTLIETPSQVTLPMNLRFAADALIVKSIAYSGNVVTADLSDMIQVWCNITNDNIIGSFPNAGQNTIPVSTYVNGHFRLNNTFQTGNFVLQLQRTDLGAPASYGPQALISSILSNVQRTHGVVTLTLEFLKLKRS